MPFVLAPMKEEDIPAFGIVDEYALGDNPMARAMQTPGTPRREMAEQFTRMGWGKDPAQEWMKVTDATTGEMAAAALWKFIRRPEEDLRPKKDDDDKPVLAPEAEADETIAVPRKEEEKLPGPPAVMAEMRAAWDEFKTEFIGDKPFAHLQILVTHPKYQRRGAGSMLVKWGCDKADEEGLMAVLQATAAGAKVYTKHGFEIVTVREMDLRPYGIDDTELRRGMVRQPRRQQT